MTGELADGKDGSYCLTITTLWGLDARFFISERSGRVRKQSKKALNLANLS